MKTDIMKTPEQRLEEFKERLEALCKEYCIDLGIEECEIVAEAYHIAPYLDKPTVWFDTQISLGSRVEGAIISPTS